MNRVRALANQLGRRRDLANRCASGATCGIKTAANWLMSESSEKLDCDLDPAKDTPVSGFIRQRLGIAHGRGALKCASVAVPATAALITCVFSLPGAGGLGGVHGIAQPLSLRGPIAAAASAVTAASLSLTLAGARAENAGITRGCRLLSLIAAVALSAQLVILSHRGFRQQSLESIIDADVGLGGITVVALNTQHGRADPDAIASLLATVNADVVSLPETGFEYAADLSARLAALGRPAQSFTSTVTDAGGPTSMLVAESYGVWKPISKLLSVGGDGTLLLEPIGEPTDRPTLAGVHPFPPVNLVRTREWRRNTKEIAGLGSKYSDIIIAGDFNATLDHPALRDLARKHGISDAARTVRAAGIGTWPAVAPWWLGAPIDHVLASVQHWAAVSVAVHPVNGSDHRAVVARLRRRR